MTYTFDIIGIAPAIDQFGRKSLALTPPQSIGVEYIYSQDCTLDVLMESVDRISCHKKWHRYETLDTVVEFWISNIDTIRYWKQQLYWAGNGTLLISRVAEVSALRTEFELLLART